MPLYEYLCQSCRRKSSFFVRSVFSALEPACQHCGSADLRRAVTSFAYHRSEQSRREAAGDPNDPASGYYEDPRNVGRWVEDQWSRTMPGEPLPGEIHEMIETARGGELPKPMTGLPDFPDPLGGLDA
jgi:putative FmdB family regulatory protein